MISDILNPHKRYAKLTEPGSHSILEEHISINDRTVSPRTFSGDKPSIPGSPLFFLRIKRATRLPYYEKILQ